MRQVQQTVKPVASKFDAKSYVRGSLTQAEVLRIKEFYDTFDIQGFGSINPGQLKLAMQQLGFQKTHKPIYQVISDYEANGKNTIGFQDFLDLMTSTVNENDYQEKINKVFALYDENKTGFMTIDNLRTVAKSIGQYVSEQQLKQMFEKADKDKDGFVSQQQFYQLITKKGH